MPDFKFKYIMEEGPWILDEIGLVDDRNNNSFYELTTGHPATEIDVMNDAITFLGPIQYEQTESDADYLSYLFLDGVDTSNGEIETTQRVVDVDMAHSIGGPSVWSEGRGDIISITHDGKEMTVPTVVWVYEFIPFAEEITTVAELRQVLEEISGESVFGINIPE